MEWELKEDVIMKITSFNPLIATAHSDSIIKLFEELGFERRHTKEGIEMPSISSRAVTPSFAPASATAGAMCSA